MINKTKNFIKSNPLFIPFVVSQTVFYFLMHFVKTGYTTEIMYGSIILCFLYATAHIKFSWDNNHFVWLGVVFTCIADFFLVMCSPAKETEGVLSFSIVQLLYFTYLFLQEKKEKVRVIHVVVRGIAILICSLLPFIVLKEKVDFLSVLSMFYISNLAVNVAFALFDKKTRLFGIGLLLFILCDFSVGFCAGAGVYFNIIEGGLLSAIVNSNFNVAWLFYLPSQVVISIFLALNFQKAKREEIQKEISGE